MKYLNKFDTYTDYEESASMLEIPNVAYITATTEVIYNATPIPVEYITFADPLVESKCATLYGDGTGCTEEDLGAVTAMSASDWCGTSITSFDELGYFTGLTAITDNAFSGCTDLTSVTIPDSVIEIKQNAFQNCSGLTEVSIPDSVTGISYGVFANCSGLTSVTIGDSVGVIGGYGFYGCSSLSAITFMSDTPPTLGLDGVFSGQPTTGDITVPDGSESNFFDLAQTLGENWTVNNQAPPEPEEYVQFADPSVEQKCIQLYSSDGIGCTESDLGDVWLLNANEWKGSNGSPTPYTSFDELRYFLGITSIPESCFDYSPSLTSVTIPETVTVIGRYAFYDSPLESITFMSETCPGFENSVFHNQASTGNITVPDGSEANYYSLAQSLGEGWTVNNQTPPA